MIARLVSVPLVLICAGSGLATVGILGDAVDRGDVGLILFASAIAALCAGGVLFFGRDVIRGLPPVEPVRDHLVLPPARADGAEAVGPPAPWPPAPSSLEGGRRR